MDENDMLLLVDNFNAKVSSSVKCEEDPAVGKMNEAGKTLLSLLALNEIAIMNTYIQKRSSHKPT